MLSCAWLFGEEDAGGLFLDRAVGEEVTMVVGAG